MIARLEGAVPGAGFSIKLFTWYLLPTLKPVSTIP